MGLLEKIVLGNAALAWIKAITAMLATFVVLLVFKGSLGGKFAHLAGKVRPESGRMMEGLLSHTKKFFLLALAIFCGSLFLEIPGAFFAKAQRVLVLIILAQLGIWCAWLISYWVENTIAEKKEMDPAGATGIGAIGFLLRLGLWVAVLLLALENLGFNISALLAGLGVGGIAVALAVQNILGDLFASLTIVLDKPFVIGDAIDVGELTGTVEHIGLKTTRVRSLSGEQIVFSNANLIQSRIKNFNKLTERRILASIGVTYQTPAEKLKQIPHSIRQIIESHESVRFDRAHFKAYGDSSLIFEIVYFVLDPDYKKYMDIQQSVNFAILDRFQLDGIEFAYPTQIVINK
jgi:small-conductance mechanosensitive channel